ncbi:6707_t:CDS:2, partial [Cetraspora pellucida]
KIFLLYDFLEDISLFEKALMHQKFGDQMLADLIIFEFWFYLSDGLVKKHDRF